MTPRNQVMVVAAIFGIVAAVDFVQRIHVSRSPGARDPNIEAPALPAPPISLAEARQRLQSWFPKETPPLDSQAVTSEASDNQSVSLPDTGEIAGWRFKLRGVFDAGPSFAVLDVMSSSGGEVEQHRLFAGDAVKGVVVDRISGHSVSLSDGETIMRLELFVEPKNNATSANDRK